MSTKDKKILLIEDDPTQAMMYELCFANAGYKTFVAHGGHEGIVLAKNELPDMIFLDMIMGDMEGIEVLKTLKADPATKDIRIVGLSNLNKKEFADRCRQAGALDFLVKMQYLPRDIVDFAGKQLGIA